MLGREATPGLIGHEGDRCRPEPAYEVQEDRKGCKRHGHILAHGVGPPERGGRAG
jgi:hypothetical protein